MAKYLRPLDPSERLHLALYNTKVYNNVQVGVRLQLHNFSNHPTSQTIPRSKDQWLHLLAGPLAWLVQQHPSLAVVVGDILSATPAYWQLPSVDFAQLVHYETIQHVTEMTTVIEAKHTLSFDVAKRDMPLWRLFVVHVLEDDTYFLILCYHHIIADAGSFVALSEQLVERLNLEATTTTTATANSHSVVPVLVVPSSQKPLPPSLEMRANCKPSLRTIVGQIAPFLMPGFIKRLVEKRYWAGDFDACAENPHETQVGHVTLSEAETLQVLRVAKEEHQMTMHSLLMAAAAFATKAVFMSSGGETLEDVSTNDEVLRTATLINVRPLVTPVIDRFEHGNYVSDLLHKDVSVLMDTSFWEVARFYAQDTSKTRSTPGGVRFLLEFMGLFGLMPSGPGKFEDSVRSIGETSQHGRQASLRCSNMGRAWAQETPQEEGDKTFFKVLEAVFSQSAANNGGAITLSVVTANNRLAITGTWQMAAMAGRERGERMVQMIKRVLVDATSSPGGDYVFRDMLLRSQQEK